MTIKPQNIQRVLVIGAGRGGTAMLELFLDDPLIKIVGIFDADSQAPALAIAQKHGVRNFTNLAEAIEASRPCLAFNLTGDDSVTAYTESQLGNENVIGGFQARFLWNLLTRLKQTNEQIT
jgi:NADH/NAD ratio-sensing transcriptional regulator Rex